MIILKIGLKQKKNSYLPVNYTYYLREVCKSFLDNEKDSSEIQKQLNISPIFCSNYEIKDSNVVIKDKVDWYISSQFYDSIILMVQKLFHSDIIKLGIAEFEVKSLEIKTSLSSEEISLQRAVLPAAASKKEAIGSKIVNAFTIFKPKEMTTVERIDETRLYSEINFEEADENFSFLFNEG